MGQAGRPLVVLVDGELGMDPAAGACGDLHVQPGRVLRAAAEADAVVRTDPLARRRRLGMAFGTGRVIGRINGSAAHAPTLPSPGAAADATLGG